MNAYLHPIARFLMALIFLMSGFNKLVAFGTMSGFLGSLGWPAPALWLALAVIIEIVGGLALLLGWKARWGAAALIVFTLAATIFVHGALLSKAADAQAKQDQMVNILKNIAIIGGLLKFYVDGAGRYAVDRD
jgi:putative oxidoreductase